MLAERKNNGASWVFKDEFLVTREGFSILRAEWHNTLHNADLKKSHPVRDAWEAVKDVESRTESETFDVAEWEKKLQKDEELPIERRVVAFERRRICAERLAEDISVRVEGRACSPEVKKEKGRETGGEG